MGWSPGSIQGQPVPRGWERLSPSPDSIGFSPCERSRERKSCQTSIFRPTRFQNALIQMKFPCGGHAKLKVDGLQDGGVQSIESSRRVEAGESQMGRECSLVARN